MTANGAPLLAKRSAFPAAELAERADRARSLTKLADLLSEVSAVAERYKGVDWMMMGHTGQAGDELSAFAKVLLLRPRSAWRTICEIGFNAGHSAAFWLHNTDAHLMEFDIATLPYSRGSRAFIESLYHGRSTFFIGDSKQTMARYMQAVRAGTQPACDLWFVDGAHHGSRVEPDLRHALGSSAPNAWLLADDCTRRFRPVLKGYTQLVHTGRVYNVSRHWNDYGHPEGLKGWCMGIVNTSVPGLWHFNPNITVNADEVLPSVRAQGAPRLHARGRRNRQERGSMLPGAASSLRNGNGGGSLAWEPLPEERRRCASQASSPHALAECVRAHWRRCIGKPGAGSEDECWQAATRGYRPKWLQVIRPAARAACDRKRDWVWASMLNGNSVNYTNVVLVQAWSVRLFSCYRHVVLVTPEVRPEVRSLLSSVSEVREIQPIEWANRPAGIIDGYAPVFAKLNVFEPKATGHAVVAFLDADIFLTSPAADQLLDVDCAEVTHGGDGPIPSAAARMDVCTGVDQVSRLLQAGVLVVRPSAQRFRAVMSSLDAYNTSRNAELPDIAFLSDFFRMREHFASDARSNRTERLRAEGVQIFNVDRKGLRFPSPHDPCIHISKYAATHSAKGIAHLRLPSTRGQIEGIDLWHHCGPFKLDRLPTCQPESDGWASSPVPFCNFRPLRVYQFLVQQFNPCAAHGASEVHCRAHGSSCQWCSDDVRCAPKSWHCGLADRSTVALASRLHAGFKRDHLRPGWCSLRCDPACCAKKRRAGRRLEEYRLRQSSRRSVVEV
jgi:hypothetical protein